MNTIKTICGTCLGTVIGLLGGADTMLRVFLTIVFLDMFTGVIKACYFGEYKSSKFREGIYRKIAYFVAIILVIQLDLITGNTGTFRSILITFLVYNEMISIVENLGEMGVPFPSKIKDAIEILKEKK